MKKPEEYLKQYKPIKAHGTEYVHKQTAVNAIKRAQEDILKESGYVEIYNEVAFRDGSFGVIGENTGDLIPFSEYPVTNEVIAGNIHDNPSLLQ